MMLNKKFSVSSQACKDLPCSTLAAHNIKSHFELLSLAPEDIDLKTKDDGGDIVKLHCGCHNVLCVFHCKVLHCDCNVSPQLFVDIMTGKLCSSMGNMQLNIAISFMSLTFHSWEVALKLCHFGLIFLVIIAVVFHHCAPVWLLMTTTLLLNLL